MTEKHELIFRGGSQVADDAPGRAKRLERANDGFAVGGIVPYPNVEVLCRTRVAMQAHCMPTDH